MQTETSHIIKKSDVKVEGSYTLEIGPLSQAATSSHGQAPASTTPKAVLVENQKDFAVIETTCACSRKMYLKCTYSEKNTEEKTQNNTDGDVENAAQ